MKDKITWLECPHGNLLKTGCVKCDQQKQEYLSILSSNSSENKPPTQIAIYRGCSAKDGCFCSGRCKEIIGYREPLYVGEKA